LRKSLRLRLSGHFFFMVREEERAALSDGGQHKWNWFSF
jgi:hypothetical protein